ncbi:MAG: arylsulfatase, partial [Kiritimatiellaeota bacterium]|nr:arylsulfatase [Kiritimatiellota bacterium]
AVCTPSRYGLLTGRYNWRRLQHGIVWVYGAPLIREDRLTVARFLKNNGYNTACFGKWHLGLDWGRDEKGEVDFSQPIKGGPNALGFDHYFGVDAANWAPYCFIENDRTVGIPNEKLPFPPELYRGVYTDGPAVKDWKLEDMLPTITSKACNYIEEKSREDKPFFLYYALTSPHSPIAVNDEWKGKSGLNDYADFVMETDANVGRVLDTVKKCGIDDNTLVIMTSDNGCAHYIGTRKLEKMGHFPSAEFRGYKADAWDGGHRIPFAAKWPAVIKPGSVCDKLASLSDFFATCADILGGHVPGDAAEDSVSILPLLQGKDEKVRDAVVHHSFTGRFAVRKDEWKMIFCPGSGGFSEISFEQARLNGMTKFQLYNIQDDVGEKRNLYGTRPDVEAELTSLLQAYIDDGRSTPGEKQKNDIAVEIVRDYYTPFDDPGDLA